MGLVLGLIAKAIIPGRQQIPLWLTTILGMIGAVLGNWIAAGLGIDETRGIDWGRHILQLIGAVVMVGVGDALYAMARGNRRRA
ncbi:GlsB/YeaQ/YmgE family stress response membrane protein [Streptomyces cremeus]